MPRCPFATFRPIPPHEEYERWPGDRAQQQQTQLIVHSAVGSYGGSLAWWEKQFDWRIYSTFFVLNDGELIQLIDSSYRSVANSTANARAISVETEDYADPDRRPFTRAQIKTLIRLAEWVHEAHGIPLAPCPEHDAPGIGFHAMWSDLARVNPWIAETKNVKAKTCPGLARIPQFFDEILTGVGYPLRGTEIDDVYQRWSRDPRKRSIAVPAPKGAPRRRPARGRKRRPKRQRVTGRRQAWLQVDRPEAGALAFSRARADEVFFERRAFAPDDDDSPFTR